MSQPLSDLPPVFAPRMDSLLHRLHDARVADGKEHLQRMDHEIHDNLLSSAPIEFCQKFLRLLLAIPLHTT